jgi:glycosyltransferase involved in cell wall biosynthesis
MAIPASRLHVISNGVDLPPPCRSRKAWRNKLQTGNRDFVACMPANISRAKDHATLLHAWRRVVDQWSGAGSPVLWLAGRAGDSFIAIHDLAQRLGLGSAVRFPGFTDDVAGLLAASDLVVYSSRSEGSPNAVLEGMAAGRAVVASDIVAHRELLGSRETLTTPGDARELAQRILEMAANAERRRSHARRNHRRARKFTAQQMCRASCRRLALLLNQARRS